MSAPPTSRTSSFNFSIDEKKLPKTIYTFSLIVIAIVVVLIICFIIILVVVYSKDKVVEPERAEVTEKTKENAVLAASLIGMFGSVVTAILMAIVMANKKKKKNKIV